MTKALLTRLKTLNNQDYQNRKGNYPKSDIPTDIRVQSNEIIISFKNTSEEIAKRFAENLLKAKSGELKIPKNMNINIRTYQDGDYHDDWVCATITLDR